MVLRASRSAANARVTLYTLPAPGNGQGQSGEPINVQALPANGTSGHAQSSTGAARAAESAGVKQEESPIFTSLRRSTRSLASPASSAASPARSTALASASRQPDLEDMVSDPATVNKASPETARSTPRKRPKLEPVTPTNPALTTSGVDDEAENKPTPSRSSSKRLPLEALDKPHPEPARWREQYRLIERMRRGINAPVDTMGCERPRDTTLASPKTLRFHILISLMLSSQTKDPVTAAAVTNLHSTLPGGLTAESLAEATPEMVQECINKVGFWRRKTEYIQDAAGRLLEQEGDMRGDCPKTIEALCEIRGVGPKMAFLALQAAWNINAGIGVDVHVHRITNRLKWHKPPTSSPEATRLNLQSWLPDELFKGINGMMVGFGQVICLPVGPRCDICLLGSRRICPSRVAGVKAEGRKGVEYWFEDPGEGWTGEGEEIGGRRLEDLKSGAAKRVKLEVMYDPTEEEAEDVKPDLSREVREIEEQRILEQVRDAAAEAQRGQEVLELAQEAEKRASSP